MDVSLDIAAPAGALWRLLIDTQRWSEWGPSVSAVECTDRWLRQGSRGRLRTPLGLWLPFEITLFDPPRRWCWRVLGIAATGHRVEALGPQRSRLVFEIPATAFPYALVCRMAARRIADLLAQEPGKREGDDEAIDR